MCSCGDALVDLLVGGGGVEEEAVCTEDALKGRDAGEWGEV